MRRPEAAGGGAAAPAAALGAALLRVTMGVYFLAHVAIRLTVIGWPAAVQFFRSIGLPPATALLITGSEACVGLLLLLGWLTRPAALVGAIVLGGATILVHLPNGFLFTNAGGGWEYPLFWMIALLCQCCLGPGAWSALRWVRISAEPEYGQQGRSE